MILTLYICQRVHYQDSFNVAGDIKIRLISVYEFLAINWYYYFTCTALSILCLITNPVRNLRSSFVPLYVMRMLVVCK